MNIFLILVISTIGAFQALSASVDECLTIKTYNKLQQPTHKDKKSRISHYCPKFVPSENIEYRKMNDIDYNSIFPVSRPLIYSCGKLEMDFRKENYPFVATACLLGYCAEKELFEGISAKHNFVKKNKLWFNEYAYNVSFYIGQHNGTNIGKIIVKEFIPHPNLDICLFYGTIDNKSIPPIQYPIIRKKFAQATDIFSMVHYPYNDEFQRENKGGLKKISKLKSLEGYLFNITDMQHGVYESDTLHGSSGAPLLDKNKQLLGIHIKRGKREKNKIILYTSNSDTKNLCVSRENECVLINEELIRTLRKRDRIKLA